MPRAKKPAQTSGRQDPTLKVEQWPIGKVLPYVANARTHPDAQLEQIRNSILEFGFVNPCLVDANGVLIAGHGRAICAAALGMKTVPVIQLGHLTETQAKALRLADNAIAANAGWNQELLKVELFELKKLDFDIKLLGFDNTQLVQFMASPTGVDPDEAPEPPVVPVSRTGDLWLMGDHRLLCSDSTDPEAVARLMDGKRAVLFNSDAPYGVNYGDIANSRSRAASVRAGGNGKNYSTHDDKTIENDDLDGVALQEFLTKAIKAALPHLIENPAFYLWHPMLTQGTFFAAAAAAAAADILIHRQIIWVKPSLIMGRGDYHWRHELCFYGWIRGKRCAWLQGRDQDTVWAIARENDGIHPTQKPVELFIRPIKNHTRVGDVVYEPFSGSGSQIAAAQTTGRKCYAMEIAPEYVDVGVVRWQGLAGEPATLDSTGQTFDEVAKERAKKPRQPKGARDAPVADSIRRLSAGIPGRLPGN